MKKSYLLVVAMLISLATFAQKQVPAKAVFFAENGERFWLILSGQKINQEPAFRVVAENLTEPSYRVKIIFQDDKFPSLDKNITTLDYNEVMSDVTYSIKKNKKGEFGLTVVSFQPAGTIKESFKEEPEVEKPKSNVTTTTPATKTPATTTTTPATTTTITPSMDGVNININLDPNSMNIKMNEQNVNVKTSVTAENTYTEKTASEPTPKSTSEPAPKQTEQPQASSNSCVFAMSNADFQKLKASVAAQSFTETQLKIAKTALKNGCVNVKQVIELVKVFAYEETRLDFAKFAYDKTVDKNNYYQVGEAFSYSTSVDELTEFIDQK